MIAGVPSASADGRFSRRPFHVLGSRRTTVKEVILTPNGYKKLQAEIEELSTVRRREVAERIRIAREF